MNFHWYLLDSHQFYYELNPGWWGNQVVVSVRLTPLIFSALRIFIGVLFFAVLDPFRVVTRLISVPSAAFVRNRSDALNQEQSDAYIHEGLGRQLRFLPAPHVLIVGLCVTGDISQPAAIEMLPDEILLEIFHFDRLISTALSQDRPYSLWDWHRLIHVRRRWRCIIFESPRSLDLQLFCSYGTPVKDNLDCWPALPIVMRYLQLSSPNHLPMASRDEDNICAALQHPHRICKIELTVTTPLLERLPNRLFPALEHLEPVTQIETGYTLPSGSFDGHFPSVRVLKLTRIAFTTLQPLILSAANIISLHLEGLPSNGYSTPEALLIFLPMMTRLETLHLYFLSPVARLIVGRNNPIPQRRIVFPSLEGFAFRGICEDLECLLCGADAPVLKDINLIFFNQASTFDTTQLLQFVCRAETQK
jgi:hypothetical protein